MISSNILQSPIFQAALAKIDSRNMATFCDECNKKFANQIIFENHLQIAHNLSRIKTEGKDMKMMIQSQWNPQMAQKTQMLVKTLEIPMWSKTNMSTLSAKLKDGTKTVRKQKRRNLTVL